MKRSTLALMLCVAFQPAMALIESEEVQVVKINGGYSGGTLGGYTSGGGYTGGTYSGGTYYDGSGSYSYTYALNAVTLSSDVRCNPVAQANELVRTTTSASEKDIKFLAANTLFRLIYAQLGGSTMQAALTVMPKATGITMNGKVAVLWKTTWHDGSTSTHLVFPFLPPLFTDQQPSVNGDTPPSGNTTCPAKG